MKFPPIPGPLKTAASFLLLAALYLFFHAPTLFGGKVYMNQWIFRNHAPFPTPDPGQVNFLNQSSDFVTHYFSYMWHVAEAIRAGVVPLWNPRLFCGFPMYADNTATVFSPFNILFRWLGVYQAYNGVLLCTFFAGAALLFFYARRHLNVSRPAAVAGSAALMFCPFLLQNIDYYLLMPFVWSLPAVLLACEEMKGRNFWSRSAVLALVLFLTAVMGHTHVLLYTVFVYTTYALAMKAEGDSWPRKFAGIAATLLFFALLSAFLVYPRAVFLLNSQRVLSPTSGWRFFVPLTPVVALYPVLPKLPRYDDILQVLSAGRAGFCHAYYVGLLPFFFSVAAVFRLFSKTVDRRIRFFIVMNLLYYVSMCVSLPGLAGRFVDFGVMRFHLVYIVSSAVLTAFAIDRLVDDASFRRAFRAVVLFFFFGIIVPFTAVSVLLSLFPQAAKQFLSAFGEAHGFLGRGNAYEAGRFDELFEIAFRYLSIRSPFVWVPFVTGSVLLVFIRIIGRRQGPPRDALKWALVGVLLAELLTIGAQLRPIPVDKKDVFPRTRVTDFLKKDPGLYRIMSIQSRPEPGTGVQKYIFKANLGIPYGLDDVAGQNSVVNSKYAEFAFKYLTGRPERTDMPSYLGILDFESFNLNAAGFVNVKYLLASAERPIQEEGLTPVLTAEGLTVYENKKALPRIFFTRRVTEFTNQAEAFRGMMDQSLDVEPLVRVKGAGALGAREPFLLGPAKAPQIEHFGPNVVRLKFDAKEPGMLVYTDTMDPGWKAYDNGGPARVYEVNGLFKGVWLGLGPHSIRFQYSPSFFYPLAGLSLVALLCLLLLLRF